MLKLNPFAKALKKTTTHFPALFKYIAPEVIALFLGCELLYYYFHYMASLSDETFMQLSALLGELSAGLLEFLVLTMLIPLRVNELKNKSVHKDPFWPYAMRRTPPLCLESLRVIGFSLLWALALIIPGIFKYIRYTFVPYIVLVDKNYDKGDVDALDKSNALVKGITLPLFILLLLFGSIEYGQTYIRKAYGYDAHLIAAVANFAIGSLLSLFANALLYELYLVRDQEINEG
jgi:hypothetical protein